jgi:hypothetical protein
VRAIAPLQPQLLHQVKTEWGRCTRRLVRSRPCVCAFCHGLNLFGTIFVVHCVERQCGGGWCLGLISMMRQVLLPVHVMRTIVCPFMCFELQCNHKELNILQKTFMGSQPMVSWVSFLITRNEALAAHACPIYPRFASLLCFVQ